jgi:hypothetical protein
MHTKALINTKLEHLLSAQWDRNARPSAFSSFIFRILATPAINI